VPDLKQFAFILHELNIDQSTYTLDTSFGSIANSANIRKLLVVLLLPYLFVLAFFGKIPLGEPEGPLQQKLIWLLVVNPITYTVLSLLLTILFFSTIHHNAQQSFKMFVELYVGDLSFLLLCISPSLSILSPLFLCSHCLSFEYPVCKVIYIAVVFLN
jgi:hypothetical protein